MMIAPEKGFPFLVRAKICRLKTSLRVSTANNSAPKTWPTSSISPVRPPNSTAKPVSLSYPAARSNPLARWRRITFKDSNQYSNSQFWIIQRNSISTSSVGFRHNSSKNLESFSSYSKIRLTLFNLRQPLICLVPAHPIRWWCFPTSNRIVWLWCHILFPGCRTISPHYFTEQSI